MAENKTITADTANESITPCDGVTAAPYFLNLLPSIAQGVAQSQRIGNEVRITKNTISGYINLKPYSATNNPYTCPIIVKMWVVSWKYANTAFTTPSLTDFATFFERGSATSNFIGNPLDMLRAVNKDAWTVHRTKTFELSSSNVTGTPAATVSAINQNPSSLWSHKYYFSLGKYAKSLKYNDGLPNTTSNRNLYLVIQTVKADGTSVAVGDLYAENHYVSQLYYEDI